MKRTKLVAGALGVLGLGAIIATTAKVLGEAGKGKGNQDLRSTGLLQNPQQDRQFEAKYSECRFTGLPLVSYKTQNGDSFFALQVQPKLEAVQKSPRDILLLIDTSASQAVAPIETSRKIASMLVDNLGAEDRLSIWTVSNDSKDISRGFKSKKDLQDSLAMLQKEYASGGTNLKKGLQDSLQSFEAIDGRKKVLLFLGDGMSVAGPIDGTDRASLCEEMVRKEVVFYPMPIGPRLDPTNLHGLASGTGGLCLRLLPGDWLNDFFKRLQTAMDVPVMYPSSISLPKEVTEFYPAKLPPLRSDAPTLVVGKTQGKPVFEYQVQGRVAGKETTLSFKENLPASEPENYFLIQVLQQWKNRKDVPALIQADRALAYAAEQNQVAVSDLKEKAEWALREDKFDAASRLFNQALDIDPQDPDAKNGAKLVEKLRDNKITIQQLKKDVQPKQGETVVRLGAQGKKSLVPVAQIPTEPEKAKQLPKPDIAQDDLLKEIESRRAVADQAATQNVDELIRRANRMVTTSPDEAVEVLKRILESTQTNPDISPKTQTNLTGRIERALQAVTREGRRVKRDQDERLELMAKADARSAQTKIAQNLQDRVRERMRVFHNLVNQAKELEAMKQADGIRQDMVNLGLPVPQAVTAAYAWGQRAYYLRELRDLQRIRDDKWLATLFEVERSHIPFPDEPPVVYPYGNHVTEISGAFNDYKSRYKSWAEFSDYRKNKYDAAGFGGPEVLPRTRELKNSLLKQVRYTGLKDGDFKLSEVLDQLARVYNLEFDINEKAFAADGVMDVMNQVVASADKPLPPINGSISTVLKKILGRVPAGSTATFLLRRESIEITTGNAALAEKVVRVYPVADLIYPPPNAFNQQQGLQNATLFGYAGSFGFAGQAVANQGLGVAVGAGQLGALGGIGGLGGLGGGGMLGGGIGGMFGGVNQLGGNAGLGQVGGFAMQGAGGNFGQTGGVGPQGQFGNVGSQFGQQGGNYSDYLITIIRNVVGNGDKDWAGAITPPGAQPADPLADPNAGPEKNQIGYYLPADALVIKGTSRVHTNAYQPVIPGAGAAAGMGALDKPKDVQVANNNKAGNNKAPAVNGANNKPNNVVAAPKLDPAKLKVDPQAYWQEALEKGGDNPSMIIAIADFLAMNKFFDQAAEFLKANIRKGVVVQPWVYEALAIALRESGATPAEIERAEVAAVDLGPADGAAFLKAAKAMAEMKRHSMALAFCKQASQLEQNTSAPFEAALTYAEQAGDGKALEWAASNLLGRDWPVENKELHDLARVKMEAYLRKNKDQAPDFKMQGQRDLVIKLAWQGDADLDLQVKEPVGSVCNPTNAQSIGGGVLLGDSLKETNLETYTAAEAFPGKYEVRIKRIWGKTLGDKAQLRVIRNQGAANQTEEVISVDISKETPVAIKLEKGRRNELAYVPPPSLRPSSRSEKLTLVSKDILTQLRDIADPEITGIQKGNSIANGEIPVDVVSNGPSGKQGADQLLYQTRVQSFMKNTLEMTAQVSMSADRRNMRVSLTPKFEAMGAYQPGSTVVTSSVIPGGN